jgi:ribonucleoside-diphosphate reductase alpha chain
MKIYNTATDVIKQGGARRGANMGILRVDHPDILEFVHLKREEGELLNFNISVAVTGAFMRALLKNTTYTLKNPRNGRPAGKLRAREVFDELVKSAWETGDPGVLFIDRINRANPTPKLGTLESTNPCGEQPLLPYEACILGSLDLSKYVEDGHIDYGLLGADIRDAVRFLDNCIDASRYPIEQIADMHRGNRKIGLGVMGWADTLALMGIPYASEEALARARKIMQFIREQSREASAELARGRGVFPNFKGSIYDRTGGPKLRNATLTTIAPTGTLSMIAGCSSGIEPYFALAYRRKVLDTEIHETNRLFDGMARQRGFYSKTLMEDVSRKGDLRGVKGIPSDLRRIFRTAHEITPEWHVKMQAAFQKYTDNAVSKTINLPRSAKPKDVEQAYMLAYELGCKGITVFRSGTARQGTLERLSDTD